MLNDLCKANFERALAWRSVGVSTFPIVFNKKRPIVKWSQYRNRLPKPIEIKRFFTSYKTNLGVICGGKFGLTVIDFDTENGYEQFIKVIPKGISRLFKVTYKVITPRGIHVYFRSPDMPTIKDTERKIDVKAEGGYVAAPFSIHPSGTQYLDYNEFDPDNILSVPKKVLLSLFPKPEKKQSIDWGSMGRSSQNGNGVFPSPNADLEDIRARIPILRLAMDYTSMFPERRNGSTFWKGRCPLPEHDDKDPSFWVDTSTGLCGCFGSCELSKKSTDVIGLYSLINGISYGEAVKELESR